MQLMSVNSQFTWEAKRRKGQQVNKHCGPEGPGLISTDLEKGIFLGLFHLPNRFHHRYKLYNSCERCILRSHGVRCQCTSIVSALWMIKKKCWDKINALARKNLVKICASRQIYLRCWWLRSVGLLSSGGWYKFQLRLEQGGN